METLLLQTVLPIGYVFMFFVCARWAYRHYESPFKRDPVDAEHMPYGMCFFMGLFWPLIMLLLVGFALACAGHGFGKIFRKSVAMPNRRERHELAERGLTELRKPEVHH
jgi:O-antigen/teichoic acid export membrane protein